MISDIFYLSVFFTCFAYLGYPLSLWIITLIYKRDQIKDDLKPFVTVIIAAHNEEKAIGKKIENTFTLSYPVEKLQIIVASDGSSDGTDDIVRGYESRGVELLQIPERRGKEHAQIEAIENARGEILVFTDVATMIDPEGLSSIVRNFADPSVGCVSSVDRLVDEDGKVSGEGVYVRYEMWLRGLETKVNSVVGLSGSFFAARRSVCRDLSEELDSDFQILLKSVSMGLRGVSDPESAGYYRNISDDSREFERKVRTVLRGITLFFHNLGYLNPFRYRLFAYQYFSHKLLRWSVPFFLILLFITNLFLVTKSILFTLFFLGQIAFYGAGFWAYWSGDSKSGIFIKIPRYFISVNGSILVAWIKYLKGDRIVTWTPSRR